MKHLVGAFNQENGPSAFPVIVKPMDRFTALLNMPILCPQPRQLHRHRHLSGPGSGRLSSYSALSLSPQPLKKCQWITGNSGLKQTCNQCLKMFDNHILLVEVPTRFAHFLLSGSDLTLNFVSLELTLNLVDQSSSANQFKI